MDATSPADRVTLDGQLVEYWLREAARLDTLAAEARFAWQRRRYLRKADQARGQAERSRTRELARGGGTSGGGASGDGPTTPGGIS